MVQITNHYRFTNYESVICKFAMIRYLYLLRNHQWLDDLSAACT